MAASFVKSLEGAAKPIRTRLLLRRVLSGLGLGLLAGAALGGVAYLLRFEPRPLVVGAAALLGSAAGAFFAQRRRLSLHEVSLYLDAKLETEETLSTALAVEGDTGEVAAFITDKAETLLRTSDRTAARPSVFSRVHALVPAGAALSVAICLVDLPPLPPPPPAPPGAELVTEADVPEIDRALEALESVVPRDPEQEKRLADLREKAKNIKEKLRKGATKREIQSELSELSQGVLAEKLSFGEGDDRRGLERAIGELADESLEGAKEALQDRDLTELDDEMARLANQLEKESRDKAKKALENAAKAAREEGAENVAKSLEQRAKKLGEEGKKVDELKAAAETLKDKLSDEAKADLEKLKQDGDPDAKKRLAEEMKDLLSKMTPEDKKALSDALAKEAERTAKDPKDPNAPTKDAPSENPTARDPEARAKAMKELAEKLSTKEGQDELREQLDRMSKGEQGAGEDAQAQELLRQAQAELDAARKNLGAGSTPAPSGTGDPGQSGDPAAGGSGGAPKKKRVKATPMSSNKALKSRADTPVRDGKTLPSMKTGRAPSRPGETANRAGTGALGQVGPDEVGGVSRSEVPEEYREQVGRYFEP